MLSVQWLHSEHVSLVSCFYLLHFVEVLFSVYFDPITVHFDHLLFAVSMPRCRACDRCGRRHLQSRSCTNDSIAFCLAARRGDLYASASFSDNWPGHFSVGDMKNECPNCKSRSWSNERLICCDAGERAQRHRIIVQSMHLTICRNVEFAYCV